MAFAVFSLPIILSIALLIICFLIIWGLIKFILYIFQSFGLLNIAKKEKYSNPYIAWIPGVSHYILGRFCIGNKQGIWYAVLTVIKVILFISIIFIDNTILFYSFLIYTGIYFIIDMLVMNRFYKKVYKHTEFFTISTIITLGLLKPIFLYIAQIERLTKIEMNERGEE